MHQCSTRSHISCILIVPLMRYDEKTGFKLLLLLAAQHHLN
uniref:Uncharacterized protein n=1 Tax=Arundo donax TaxID=35708 RepID=A0A0A9ARR0_ARUDO